MVGGDEGVLVGLVGLVVALAVEVGVLVGLVAALTVEVGLALPMPLPLLPQAANESASKQSRLRVMNQFLRCKKKLFIEFSSLIGFREF